MAVTAVTLNFLSKRFQLFYLQVARILPTKFQVNWPFSSGEEAKLDFKDGGHGGHLGSPIREILAFLSTSYPDTSCQVSSPFGSGGEAAHRFSRWRPCRTPLISDW